MRKKSLTLLSLILAGLLLCGIGAGIVFNEFSSLDFEGEYVYSSGNIKTKVKNMSVKEIPQDKININMYSNNGSNIAKKLVVDENMQEGYIKVTSTYDADFLSPSYYVVKFGMDDGIHYTGEVELTYYERSNIVEDFFNLKDIVLKDIKNKMLHSHVKNMDVDIVITAAPQTAKRINF